MLTGAFAPFDVNAFLSKIDYFYYPHNVKQFAMLYVFFGIGFSLLVAKVKRLALTLLKARKKP